MRDKLSGRSRGFGFVSFMNKDAVDSATQQDHVLDGRNVRSSFAAISIAMQATKISREILSDLNHFQLIRGLSSTKSICSLISAHSLITIHVSRLINRIESRSKQKEPFQKEKLQLRQRKYSWAVYLRV